MDSDKKQFMNRLQTVFYYSKGINPTKASGLHKLMTDAFSKLADEFLPTGISPDAIVAALVHKAVKAGHNGKRILPSWLSVKTVWAALATWKQVPESKVKELCSRKMLVAAVEQDYSEYTDDNLKAHNTSVLATYRLVKGLSTGTLAPNMQRTLATVALQEIVHDVALITWLEHYQISYDKLSEMANAVTPEGVKEAAVRAEIKSLLVGFEHKPIGEMKAIIKKVESKLNGVN